MSTIPQNMSTIPQKSQCLPFMGFPFFPFFRPFFGVFGPFWAFWSNFFPLFLGVSLFRNQKNSGNRTPIEHRSNTNKYLIKSTFGLPGITTDKIYCAIIQSGGRDYTQQLSNGLHNIQQSFGNFILFILNSTFTDNSKRETRNHGTGTI